MKLTFLWSLLLKSGSKVKQTRCLRYKDSRITELLDKCFQNYSKLFLLDKGFQNYSKLFLLDKVYQNYSKLFWLNKGFQN